MFTGTRIAWTYADGWNSGITFTDVSPEMLFNWTKSSPESLLIIRGDRFVFISEADMQRLMLTKSYNKVIGAAFDEIKQAH